MRFRGAILANCPWCYSDTVELHKIYVRSVEWTFVWDIVCLLTLPSKK